MKRYIQPNTNFILIEGNMLLTTPPSQVVDIKTGTVTGKTTEDVF